MGSIGCSRRIPGPTSFWEVGFIAPEQLSFRKVFRGAAGLSLHMDNRLKPTSGPRATPPVLVSDREMKAESFLTRWATTQGRKTGPYTLAMDLFLAAADSASDCLPQR